MGQRTQLLVIREDNRGNVKKSLYHLQWGFGRVMYLAIMNIFIKDYNFSPCDHNFNYLDFDDGQDKRLNVNNEIPARVLDAARIDNFKSIADVFDYCDNNNGACVAYMKQGPGKFDRTDVFKVGFLLGPEDTEGTYEGKKYNEGNDKEAFARWLSPEEYGRMNGGHGYSDPEFIKTFMSFCKYFEIDFME